MKCKLNFKHNLITILLCPRMSRSKTMVYVVYDLVLHIS